MRIRKWLERMPDPRSPSRVFLPIVLLVTLVMSSLFGLLWLGAERQDRLAQERSIELVSRIINDAVRQIAREAKDYSWWNDSVRALVLSVDPDWADKNVGGYVYNSFGYEATFVIDASGRTLYASIDGDRAQADGFELLDHGLDRLIAQTIRTSAPYEPRPAGGILRYGDHAILTGVSLIRAEREGEVAMPEAARTVIVFTKRLDASFWEDFGERYGLDGFRAVPSDAASVMLPLHAADGTVLGGLTWRPARPGAAYLRSFLPAVAAAAVAVAFVTALVLRGATETLAKSEARFRDVVDASSDWIWETDRKGRITFISDRFAAVTGFSLEAMLGRPLPELFLPTEEDGSELSVVTALGSGQPFRQVLCRLCDRTGAERVVRIAGKPVFDGRGGAQGFRGTATDVTREVEAEARVRYLALHDPLTGLPNRTALRDRLEAAIAASARSGQMAAVLCIDLDRFKDVNDALGHGAGDLLIRRCAERLLACVRKADTVARLGGDEFAVIQAGIERIADVDALCRRVLGHVAEPVDLDGSMVIVSASIGVAMVPADGEEPGRLLQHADIALYRSKEEGRNGFCFFEPEMNARLQARKTLEHDLRSALAAGRLELHYQPQIALADERLVGVEALLRWRHPTEGLLPPARFVPVAEDSGLIVPIGEWALREACRQAGLWPGLTVSVNLSPVQFRHSDLVCLVDRALGESGLEPGRLELEVTESVLLHDTETALRTLQELRVLGVRIAMDDFGTGYSSLSHLHRFPFDKLKIDKAFIANLQEGGDAVAIVRAVIGLGRSLRLRVCAEGVETEAQAAFLAAEGCEEAQGHYFGTPLPAETLFERLLVPRRQAPAAPPRAARA